MKAKRIVQSRRLKPWSRSAKLLQEFARGLEDALLFGYQPRLVIRYGYDGAKRILSAKERQRNYQALKRLEKQRLIDVDHRAERYNVALTKKGREEIFRLRVLNSELLPKDRVCMVVFDVPESKRKLRLLLRRFLSEAGFAPIQKSVWISPFDAAESLRELFLASGVSEWVRVYRAWEIK